MLKLKTARGFTLVEMILVVLIVSILASIVLPRISYSTDDARKAAAAAAKASANSSLEAAHLLDNYPYPSNTSTSNTFLSNTKYFPDGNPNSVLKKGHYIFYNSTRKRFYSN